MTTLTETRWHYLSVDSSADLSAVTLEVSVDESTWVTATTTTAPDDVGDLPLPPAGRTRYWWRVLIGPDGGALELTDPTTLLFGRLTVGPETLHPSWTIYAEPAASADVDCWPVIACDDTTWNSRTAEDQRQAEDRAIATLRMLTAYRVGGCPVRLRPGPLPRCTHRDRYPAYVAVGTTSTGGLSALLGCGCAAPSGYRLPGEPTGVDEVKVDGDVLTADVDYRFLDGVLYRIDGTWPLSQDLSLPDSVAGTWSITYNPHVAPDEQAQVAAGVLACEYAKSAAGKACALPAGVKQIVRAGVTIDLVTETFPDGLTGIAAVDAFVRRWNPNRLVAAPQGIDPARYAGIR